VSSITTKHAGIGDGRKRKSKEEENEGEETNVKVGRKNK
jgi:hypothetical protein